MNSRKRLTSTIILGFLGLHGLGTTAHAQEIDWKVNFDYLFDNTEFDKSSYGGSRTLNAVMLQPIIGLKWADRHSVYGGIHVKKIPGTKNIIDRAELTLFYEYQSDLSHFRAGAFPRADVLPQYWAQFYSASYSAFNHPQMHGIFYQYGRKAQSFINLWLDWTGTPSPETRENFLFGFSGQYKRGLFFADFQSYINHLALTTPSSPGADAVQEHWLLQSTAGISWNKQNSFNGLAAVGVMAGLERNRSEEDGQKYTPVGFVARANAEYWGIGTRNFLYVGQPRMRMYDEFGALLYPGTTFLRGNYYFRNDVYVNLIQSNNVTAQFRSSQHVSEGHLFFQQFFSVKVRLDKSTANSARTSKFEFPWKKIFE